VSSKESPLTENIGLDQVTIIILEVGRRKPFLRKSTLWMRQAVSDLIFRRPLTERPRWGLNGALQILKWPPCPPSWNLNTKSAGKQHFLVGSPYSIHGVHTWDIRGLYFCFDIFPTPYSSLTSYPVLTVLTAIALTQMEIHNQNPWQFPINSKWQHKHTMYQKKTKICWLWYNEPSLRPGPSSLK
jgi:hypothetical protein